MRQCTVPNFCNEEESPLSLFSDLPIERLFRGYNSYGLSIYETDDTVAVEADIPGIQTKDLEIQVDKGVLWVKAEAVEQKENNEPNVKYHMKAARSFSYRIPVPSNVDESKAPEATCKDGVVRICFSKTKIPKPQKIEVKEL